VEVGSQKRQSSWAVNVKPWFRWQLQKKWMILRGAQVVDLAKLARAFLELWQVPEKLRGGTKK
jgi:hypothetical protein